MEKKEFPLIPFDKLNKNKRIYTKESFVKDGIPKTIPIMSSFDNDAETIGAGQVVIKEDGLYLEGVVLNDPYQKLFENKLVRFASSGEGELDENNKIKEFTLHSAFVSNNQNWAFEE